MPTSIQAVIVIVVFLMPGFIASRVLSYTYPRSEPTEARLVLTAITLSCFNYAILSWFLILSWKRLWYQHTAFLAFLVFLSVFISPVLSTLGLVKLAETNWIRRFRQTFGLPHPVPKAWDYFFRKGIPCWVLATLKGGQLVGGLYGENSFASSFPSEEDLYLERLCNLTPEGRMNGFADFSVGGIIRMENVELLELFEYEPEGQS
ncbi:MAG: DUF6338 family protein [Candidatus Acidiferrum sp.]|jgi:hypothetical protein